MSTTQAPQEFAGLGASRRDLREAAKLLEREEIRYLVSTYYQTQEFRKAAKNMALALEKAERPHALVSWIGDAQHRIEDDIKISLDVFAHNDPTGQWLLAQHGIGPVIAAGLLAHIDIHRAPTAGHIWSFAGLNPAVKWEKGKKRPWNAELKTLTWKCGDSFVKSKGSEKSFYGPIYETRKAQEVAKNEAGEFAEIARQTLAEKRIKDKATREVYEAGKLPAGRLDLRARRVAVKLFLSHFHDVLTWHTFGKRAPEPYAFAHLGHVHAISCPFPPWE